MFECILFFNTKKGGGLGLCLHVYWTTMQSFFQKITTGQHDWTYTQITRKRNGRSANEDKEEQPPEEKEKKNGKRK